MVQRIRTTLIEEICQTVVMWWMVEGIDEARDTDVTDVRTIPYQYGQGLRLVPVRSSTTNHY